ncbi:TetR/AcrR family transcriptional regulator [Levilactobacillus parabrevis]|uniref:TetR/AcrR family transcriptional regulator n=1 Tax=Levilactobacillus parabrevis TaxID=357278 RepID=UPI0021A59295|nr:TetR/AcrR family transcriptional regulator [Levilactobacillus parabrevis]MCT4488201.1 TetR/AcrR family transcriptional regulator [Levilactobacillus parabrevis]MCT4490409.1 TetR/AcrR family transcriptional regulator [Levilactobacillus parabrevis]
MTDRRVVRTKQALREAFRKLAQQYRFREITVQQLTAEANINRKTFYLHFESIDDLADSFTAEIADQLLDLILQEPAEHDPLNNSGVWFARLDDFFEKAPKFYTFILTSDDYSFLSRRVKRRVAAGLTTSFQQDYQLSAVDAQMGVNFLIDSTLTLFRLYITGQLDLSLPAFKQRLVTLNMRGLRGFLGDFRG